MRREAALNKGLWARLNIDYFDIQTRLSKTVGADRLNVNWLYVGEKAKRALTSALY